MQASRTITLKVVAREVCILQAFEFTETSLMYILIPKTAIKLFTRKTITLAISIYLAETNQLDCTGITRNRGKKTKHSLVFFQ